MKEAIKRIEIAGGIASGKTTLARLLTRIGLVPIHEKFKKNPFYLDFYDNPAGNALETEITFLLQHYHEQKRAAAIRRSFCSDFSLLLDRAYAAVTLSPRDRQLFESIHKRVSEDLPKRTLVIYLACAPEIELQRIRRRDRIAERSITLSYLKDIDRALRRLIAVSSHSERTLTIDSGTVDFAFKRHCKSQVVAIVKKALTAH